MEGVAHRGNPRVTGSPGRPLYASIIERNWYFRARLGFQGMSARDLALLSEHGRLVLMLDGWNERCSPSTIAEHWKHLCTTNVIESSFATIRHRTVRSNGCLSNKTALAMIFKLAEAAEKS